MFCFINIKNFMILVYCNLLFNLIVLVSDFYFFWSSMTILFNLVNGQQNLKFRVNLSKSFVPVVVLVLSNSGILYMQQSFQDKIMTDRYILQAWLFTCVRDVTPGLGGLLTTLDLGFSEKFVNLNFVQI